MNTPRIELSAEQKQELIDLRDRAPKAYVRERAAALLKLGAGEGLLAVAEHGLLRQRDRHTVLNWLNRYRAEGVAGLTVRAGRGRKAAFFPHSPEQARAELEQVLVSSPRKWDVARNRWRLQDLARGVRWLVGIGVSGVWRVLRRLKYSRRQAQPFVRSPDVDYDAKWRAILRTYAEAVEQPGQVRLIFCDEVTYLRQPSVAPLYARRGGPAPRAEHVPGHNTVTRIVAGLEALSGQVNYLARSAVEVGTFCAFLRHLRETYGTEISLRVVLDNWSVHIHPRTQALAAKLGIQLLYLPTYASWLNPIEKLWHWLRQDVIHCHDMPRDVATLRERVRNFLDQFKTGSLDLLHYVGLPVE